MKKLLITLFAVFAIGATASAASYKLDDASIDQVIENATEVSALDMMADMSATATLQASGKSDAIALVLDFFLGGFGIHRHYMGTRPFMWAIYTFTIGGIFGIVPFVDFIVMVVGLIEDGSLSQYYGNTSFFMWL